MENAILVHFVTLQVAVEQAAGETESLDPVGLMLGASPVVKLVLILLIAMGLGCFFIIGMKVVRLGQATRQSSKFLDLFWSGEAGTPWNAERLEGIYQQIKKFEGSPVAAVFRSGYVELARMSTEGQPTGAIDNIDRALRRTKNNELTSIETFVPFLATTGSTAPFVGLFGTVWGIMGSFIAIHGNKNATLDVVAPGIAEALIATAIGLLAAIPAVMAFNFFIRKIRVLESEVDAFSSDLLNIVRRHFITR